MMQIEDNISAAVNGITPDVLSLKGWGGGWGGISHRRVWSGCALTDTQIKCADREHNKVIRGCDMSVWGGGGGG